MAEILKYEAPAAGAVGRGMDMGFALQNNAMKSQQFDNEMSDRQEVRNAMTEYAAASDDAGREVAAGKVGIVSPQMYAQLSQNMRQANAEQRAAMQGMIDERGSMAYMALNEKDPAKRQKIWESYRNSQPEKIRGMIPEDASEEGLTVVMGQSKEMLDFMRDEKKWQRQEASADARASRQDASADRRAALQEERDAARFENRIALEDKQFQNRLAIENVSRESTNKLLSDTERVKQLATVIENEEPNSPRWIKANKEYDKALRIAESEAAAPSIHVVKTGKDKSGRVVVQYSDGTVGYAE